MTVIVYRDGVLAADRRASRDEVILAPVTKVLRHRNVMVGVCGSVPYMYNVFEWVRGGRKGKPDIRDGGFLLVEGDRVSLGGYFDDAFQLWPVSPDYYAIGSGSEQAWGLLAAGHSAVETVEYVSRVNMTCGDGVDFVSVRG